MKLPVMPPVSPMLAKATNVVPSREGLLFEPKWDGFRSIAFRDGDDLELGSRNERPLTRYFPELAEPLKQALPKRCVVDGEIVIVGPDGLEFDSLLQRIHPAESRIKRLAAETPASFVAFDVLALGDRDLRDRPLEERRSLLEKSVSDGSDRVVLTPATTDRALAKDWFERFEGAGLDGVVAKDLSLPYREGERAMVKVKHVRTADCVVGGFRWHKHGGVVGSLLLGLYDDDSVLHHVGVTSSFKMARRKELVGELEAYRLGPKDEDHPWLRDWGMPSEEVASTGRRPGSPSRWTGKRDLSWEPLRPELVCEVAYGQLQGDRFRHATTFQRFRPERDPGSCTYGQLEVPNAFLVKDVIAGKA